MSTISKELLETTKKQFSPMYSYEISDDEAAEIITNIRAFSKVLIEIDEMNKKRKEQESAR